MRNNDNPAVCMPELVVRAADGRGHKPLSFQPRNNSATVAKHQTSRFATLSALSWMKSRRGSTRSPMSSENRMPIVGRRSSLISTLSSVRTLGSSVVSQSWLGVHLAEALVALERDALAAERR